MAETLAVDNIKCGGCANTIKKALLKIQNVQAVDVDVAQGTITIDGETLPREEITQTLRNLGYPECDSTQGFDAFSAKAKSVVSCAIGRMDRSGN